MDEVSIIIKRQGRVQTLCAHRERLCVLDIHHSRDHMVQTSEKHRIEVKELQGIFPEKLLLKFLYLGFEITSTDNTGSRRKF